MTPRRNCISALAYGNSIRLSSYLIQKLLFADHITLGLELGILGEKPQALEGTGATRISIAIGLAFTTAIRDFCNFVSQVPQAFVGRALICGIACPNDIILISRPSLRRFLGTSRHAVNDHLVHSRVLESRTECSRVPPWTMESISGPCVSWQSR
jgi:hypothetical protein